MAPDDQGEKTEAPTDRRRQESRQQGQVARSTDLTSAIILLGVLGALYMLGSRMFGEMASVMHRLLDGGTAAADLNDAAATVNRCLADLGVILAPLMLTAMVLAVLSNLIQVGMQVTTEPLKPDLNKLNPLTGLGRMFSRRSLIRLVMSLGKVALVTLVAYVSIAAQMDAILAASALGYQRLMETAASMVGSLGLRIGGVLLVLALLDYLYQRWQHEQDLRMTRQELREDLKRMEGDPQIRARRQRIARQLAMQRMSRQVPKATVVITNPTHLAVALQYKEGMNAPRVLAKGADFMATRIRQIAAGAGVPIVERRPLAQALYKSCRVGDEIPVSLYQAVAEVLAYVYELARHRRRPAPVEVG